MDSYNKNIKNIEIRVHVPLCQNKITFTYTFILTESINIKV